MWWCGRMWLTEKFGLSVPVVGAPMANVSGGKLTAARGLDDHPAADAQFAHRPHDFDKQALDGLDPPEHFDLVDRVNGRCKGFHRFPCLESGCSTVTQR